MDIEDVEACYRAVKSRDRRFDGMFFTGVTTTGIYCRPSCPAVTPQPGNVTFHRTAAAAQAAGFRACKRCLPDATPGSPEWDLAADVAGRVMRQVADGVVEREGVEGLARRLGYTPRHLQRVVTQELGAGPLALARARRAQHARILVETTEMTMTDVAFAAGFSSIRQFNDTVRQVYDATPSALRAAAARGPVPDRAPTPADSAGAVTGALELRLPLRTPFASADLVRFLAAHLAHDLEASGPGWYERLLDLPHGPARVRLTFPIDSSTPAGPAYVGCTLWLSDLRDLGVAVERCRRLVDADCDPQAVDDSLGLDPALAAAVRRRPGLRVPGSVDGHETAIRAVLGQQVSLGAGNTLAGRLVARYGQAVDVGLDPVADDGSRPRRLFPRAEALAGIDPTELPMPRARGRALVQLCAVLASGGIALDRSASRSEVRRALVSLRGIGPWTADYVAMRALGDPDVFLPTDIGVRRALEARGVDPARSAELSEKWRPWRSYGLLHLWSELSLPGPRA